MGNRSQHGVEPYKEGVDFDDFIELLDAQSQGKKLPKGYVASTFLFGFVNGKIVGRVMIRHSLTHFLREWGGHIGYGVIPSERNKGYATQMLKLSLDYARDLSLSNVLLTCDEGNHASKKVIEKCGGVFEKIANYPPGQREGEFEKKLLYWLSTGKK